MSRPRKLYSSLSALAAASALFLSGCSSDNAEVADPTSPASQNGASGSADSSASPRPGADGTTLRYVFTVLGATGTAPAPDGETSKVPQEQVEEAANQLRARFAALGREDAVTVEGDKIILETAGLADDLLYLASLAPLNVQVRQVLAVIDGDGNYEPKQEPGAVQVLATDTLTQNWIDDVSDRNCIDPLKMSMAVAGAPNDSYVAYCLPTKFVREAGKGEEGATPSIQEVEKVIYGPALVSNRNIESTVVAGENDSATIDFSLNSEGKANLEAEIARINGAKTCEIVKSAPSLSEVTQGCNEVSVIIDGLALSLGAPEDVAQNGVVKVPFSFIGWEPRLVSEAAPIFSLEPLTYSFQRIE